jgi:hypothetical protein
MSIATASKLAGPLPKRAFPHNCIRKEPVIECMQALRSPEEFMTKLSTLALALLALSAVAVPEGTHKAKPWIIKADYIESCSCDLFCSCYFNTSPEGGEMCQFNNAINIRQGKVGDMDVSGKKVWLSGDLGGDFTKGMKTGVITFDAGTTRAQKDAIEFLIGKVYPVKWQSFTEDEAPITWTRNGNNGIAKLGDKAEVQLKGVTGPDGKLTVIHNLRYWGAQKNNGFELAKGEHHYKGNGLDYSYKDRNGFFIHIESSGLD